LSRPFLVALPAASRSAILTIMALKPCNRYRDEGTTRQAARDLRTWFRKQSSCKHCSCFTSLWYVASQPPRACITMCIPRCRLTIACPASTHAHCTPNNTAAPPTTKPFACHQRAPLNLSPPAPPNPTSTYLLKGELDRGCTATLPSTPALSAMMRHGAHSPAVLLVGDGLTEGGQQLGQVEQRSATPASRSDALSAAAYTFGTGQSVGHASTKHKSHTPANICQEHTHLHDTHSNRMT
jgi:hypothetical protein